MRVLLDTCTFLWIAADSPELSDHAREVFRSPENEVFLSTVSSWEIVTKHALGRLALPADPTRYLPRLRLDHGIESLALDEESALQLVRLPPLHKDPFDRMLVCQALVGGMLILTPDEAITRYPVRSAW